MIINLKQSFPLKVLKELKDSAAILGAPMRAARTRERWPKHTVPQNHLLFTYRTQEPRAWGGVQSQQKSGDGDHVVLHK